VGQSRSKGPAIGPRPLRLVPIDHHPAVGPVRLAIYDPTLDECPDCAHMAAANAQLRQERDALQWLADPVHMAAYLLVREAVEEG
jgi:hypothetical protein